MAMNGLFLRISFPRPLSQIGIRKTNLRDYQQLKHGLGQKVAARDDRQKWRQ
jgi:hypothetical protein